MAPRAGYCVWEPRVGEAFRRAVEKGVEEPELAGAITRLFTGLWSSCTKASRASLALRVFPDLTDEELEKLALMDAYINALDDVVDLDRIDEIRGSGARALYVRTVLLANTMNVDGIAAGAYRNIGLKVFDSEYRFKLTFSRKLAPRDSSELLSLLERLYVNEAYDVWYFFAFPSRRRLPEDIAVRMIEAGVLFRALWLVLDHLVDLDEDRRAGVLTGARLAVDVVREPGLLVGLVERLNKRLMETLEGLEGVSYAANLRGEHRVLWQVLSRALESLSTPQHQERS